MKKYDALVEDYVRLCEFRKIGKHTIYTRRREIEKFGLWVKRKRPRPKLEDVNAEIIINYLKAQSTCRARSTVQGKFSNLRCFFEFLVEENVWHKNPLKWIRGPKMIVNSHIPKSLKNNEVEELLKACFEVKERFFKYELPAVFLCLYSLGIRRGEASALNIEDWDRESKTLKILNSKSQCERYMPVPESLESALEAFLPVRQNLLTAKKRFDERALFINRNGFRLQGQSISKLFLGCAKRVGIDNFTVHQLRHTCATNLISRGVSLPEVKMVLGHVCIDTTLRYTHVAGPDRWEAINKHPLNNFLNTENAGRSYEQ